MRFVRVGRVLAGHKRTFASAAVGAASYFLLPARWGARTDAVVAWDIGALAFLLLIILLFSTASASSMEANAEAQQEGEWTLFWLVVAGAAVSFAAILGEFGSMKDAASGTKGFKVALVAATLLLSWLLTHGVFGLRYAHEFYTRTDRAGDLDKGLEFPGGALPDYWDFFYFSLVLGMTFQVSDVQITSRKLRRLATLHGFLGFLFNTVIVALTVNLASGLLN